MVAEGARLVARAPAKVNLTLTVLGRRADGYHDLDSIVVFAGCHDTVALTADAPLSLVVAGPRAAECGDPSNNLVLQAAHRLAEARPSLRLGAFLLTKRLPAAAGLGGGSSDAAAALRLLARVNGIALSDPRLLAVARSVGADVPVCLTPRATRMRGIGDDLLPVDALPPMFAVLVNPGVPVETRSVFAALGLKPGEAHRENGSLTATDRAALIAGAGNDLEKPARVVAPVIGDVLEALATTPGCTLARMSGSGATCFGLYADCRASAAAAKAIGRRYPAWWVRTTRLR